MATEKDVNPRKQPIQERSKFTVEAIFEAAIQIFTENGYTGSTTDLIAERAGVSIGTLYQYFPNKKAILIGIWDRNMQTADKGRDLFINAIKWEGGLNPEKMKSIVTACLDIHKDCVKPHLFFEEIPQPDFIQERLKEKESIVIALYTAILDHSANIRIPDNRTGARMIYEVMERLTHRYLLHFQNEMSEDEFISETADMISRYLFKGNNTKLNPI